MVHGAVFSCGIHGLEYYDEAIGILGIELFLQIFHLFDGFREIQGLYLVLVDFYIAVGGAFLQVDLFSFFGPVTVYINFSIYNFFHTFSSWK